jgi:uncharacterized protein YqgC (DUF456 family)
MLTFSIFALLMIAALLLLLYGFSAPLAQAALLLLYVLVDGTYAGWATFCVVLVAALFGEGIEFAAGLKGTQKAQGSTRSGWGGILGGFAGAILLSPILFPLGSLLGTFLGTFAGALTLELTHPETNQNKALRVGYWAMIGRIVGFAIKISISVGIVVGVVGSALVQVFV